MHLSHLSALRTTDAAHKEVPRTTAAAHKEKTAELLRGRKAIVAPKLDRTCLYFSACSPLQTRVAAATVVFRCSRRENKELLRLGVLIAFSALLFLLLKEAAAAFPESRSDR